MADIIEIGISTEELDTRRRRILQAKRLETPDRVPVIPAIAHRYLVPKVNVRFKDYYADPETMLRTQLLSQQWLLENIRTDAYSITGPWVGAWTDFQNTFEAGSLGCTVHFGDDDIPWVGRGWVNNERDLRTLESMDFVHTGINARQLAYRERMIAVAERYPVRFRDGEVFYPGLAPSLTHTSDGPFGVAGDLMGQAEAFEAVCDRPEFMRELLHIIVDKMIEYLDFCWEVEKLPEPKDFAWTDDLAVSLSADQYRDVVLTEELRLRRHFNGYVSLHMCGNTDHLLEIFTDDLRINEFQGFGYQVDLDLVARIMGGRVVLVGNVDPMLIASGTPEEIRQATKTVIEKLGPARGLIVQDGSNIPPGTPIENINAMMEAAELYGRYV
jgi:uroporphyrinogen decarboxylase